VYSFGRHGTVLTENRRIDNFAFDWISEVFRGYPARTSDVSGCAPAVDPSQIAVPRRNNPQFSGRRMTIPWANSSHSVGMVEADYKTEGESGGRGELAGNKGKPGNEASQVGVLILLPFIF
jgi:hypothetical protein